MRSEQELIEIKRKLLDTCKEIQKSLVMNAKEAMETAQESANQEEAATEEKFESFRAQCQADRDMFARQYSEHLATLSVLSSIPYEKVWKTVQPGSVVITDKQKMFVSVSLGKIKTPDGEYFAISPNSPIYAAMQGKKAGDKFSFRNVTHEIKEVF
ncbi:MAG: GreA/GreB family elongation factor [Cytophagales bacterium]|nr:GreA/GreB family elongation factor [Cytophagales bacterium]MDW8383493.1 hypothetical protein [Flammeovirgaceae bacterium]